MKKINGSRFIILGGGMTGLSLGWLLHRLGATVRIVETETLCGGLGRTYDLNGFSYEFGPHILHAKKKATINFYKRYEVIARNYYTKMVFNDDPQQLIDFPYSADTLKQLPLEVRKKVEAELVQLTTKQIDNTNLETYLISIFGETLYRNFNYGYSKKFWGKEPVHVPSNGVAGWINFRADDRRVFMEWQGYPKNGYNSFFKWMSEGLEIVQATVQGLGRVTNDVVASIMTNQGEVTGDYFVSTLSPEVVFNDVKTVPEYIGKIIVFLQVDVGPILPVGIGGVYFPGQGRFNRIVEYPAMNRNDYPFLNGSLLGVEYPSFGPVKPEILKDYIKDATNAVERLWPCRVVMSTVHYEPKVYPVRNREQVDLFNHIKTEKLKPLSNLYSTGRLGNFVYVNMNDCFEMALNTVADIVDAEQFEVQNFMGLL